MSIIIKFQFQVIMLEDMTNNFYNLKMSFFCLTLDLSGWNLAIHVKTELCLFFLNLMMTCFYYLLISTNHHSFLMDYLVVK